MVGDICGAGSRAVKWQNKMSSDEEPIRVACGLPSDHSACPASPRPQKAPDPEAPPDFMIQVERNGALTPSEQYALDLLVDLSRLLPTADDADPTCHAAVRLTIARDELAPWSWIRGDGASVLRATDGGIAVPATVLREVAAIAAAESELRATQVDRFGRVPSAANALVSQGAERDAPVSRLAFELRELVERTAGRRPVVLLEPWPAGHRWAVALTHDLDVVALWPVFSALRLVELARHRDFRRLRQVAFAALGAIGRSPVRDGVRSILAAEESVHALSTWFILCGTPTFGTMKAGDLTYRPESRAVRAILRAVLDGGHEIGLHGSFATYDNAELFVEQRGRLGALAGDDNLGADGARQHFLRFRYMRTACAMRTAGFSYDSSIGFSDRNGFRLGIADVVPLWDAEGETPVGLDEVPFAWMDRALSKYRGIEDPAAWTADALQLAATARMVNGLWVGIWHPNLTPPLGYPGAPQEYAALTRRLLEHNPYAAPLGELVTWRQARRAVRAVAIRPNGTIAVRRTGRPGWPRPNLESPSGMPIAAEAV